MTQKDLFKQPIEFLKKEYPEFYCRYYKGLDRLQDKGVKWRELDVTWLYGLPGTGKTREAMEGESVFKLDRPFRWFDGYEGEDTLVLDDVAKNDFNENRGLFLNILDGYPLRLDIKGSHTWAKWTKVYITSNWMPECLMTQAEWLRRVTCVRAMGNTIP